MSSPLDRMVGSDEPSPYAPRWIRDAAHPVKRNPASRAFERLAEDEPSQTADPAGVPDRGVMIERFRLPRSLEPTLLPEPAVQGPRSLFGVLRRLVLAIAIAAAIAFIVVGGPWTIATNKSGEDSNSFLSRFLAQTSTGAQHPSRPAPKLVADQAAPRRTGEPFPLGVSVSGPATGAAVVIGGLVSGTTLSAGRPADDNNWRVPATDLNDIKIQPSPGFVGTIDLTVELRLADDTVSDRRSLRFEWAGTPVPEVPPADYAAHQLDPNEIDILLKRGEELTASGDLAAARLVLQRAAEAGNAQAALALAGTYDPVVLERLPVHGFAPNIAMARSWYEKAKQFGSVDARRRLETLASRRE